MNSRSRHLFLKHTINFGPILVTEFGINCKSIKILFYLFDKKSIYKYKNLRHSVKYTIVHVI